MSLIQRTANIETTDGRNLFGRAFYYDKVYEAVTDNGYDFYNESYALGCADKSITERGRYALGLQHNLDRAAPIGSVVFRSDTDGLYFEAKVSNTSAGDEALALLADEALSDVSIGAKAIRHQKMNNVLVRQEIALRELSLCPPSFGALAGSEVLAVRSASVARNALNRNRYRLLLLSQSV